MREVALVTGGARGIGRASALALASAGYDVAVLDLDAVDTEDIRSLRAAVVAANVRFHYCTADVTRRADVDAAAAACVAELGAPAILVNNAGKGSDPVPLETLSEDGWDASVALNLKGAFLCSRALVGHMKARGRGVIVNIASTAGRGDSPNSGAAYASAKAGIVGFTRQIARELGPFGIRVNAIAPGSILTGRAAARFERADAPARERTLQAIPLRRMGRPEDVAHVIVFLASPAASFITGAVLDVNGGRSMV